MITNNKKNSLSYLSSNGNEVVFMALEGKCIYRLKSWTKVINFIPNNMNKINMLSGRVEGDKVLSENIWPVYEEVVNFADIDDYNRTDHVFGLFDGTKLHTDDQVYTYTTIKNTNNLDDFSIEAGMYDDTNIKTIDSVFQYNSIVKLFNLNDFSISSGLWDGSVVHSA